MDQKNKGDGELEAIAKKLDKLDGTVRQVNVQESLVHRYDSEIGSYKSATMRNILFAAALEELEFSNKDIKLMLEYASATFDDIDPTELLRIRVVCTSKGRIKKSSSATSIDSLIKALL